MIKKILIFFIISLLLKSSVAASVATTTEKLLEKNLISENKTSLNIRIPQKSNLDNFQPVARTNGLDKTPTTCPELYSINKTLSNTESNETIVSPGYPKENYTITLTLEDGAGIDLEVSCLDISPINDYLRITLQPEKTGVNEETITNNVIIKSVKPIIITGHLTKPLKLRAVSSTIVKIEFITLGPEDPPKEYKGFTIKYKQYGEKLQPPTFPPDITVPFEKLDTVSKLIVVARENQTVETWKALKVLICNATNEYLSLNGSILEPCYPENVTFTNVFNCPTDWPDSPNCVEIYFAIQLYESFGSITTIDPFQNYYFRREPAGLNGTEMLAMWNIAGLKVFQTAGYPEYQRESENDQLLLWMSVGVGVILIIFIIAVAFLKTGVIKNKWVALDEENDKKDFKDDKDDIVMYQSPDQIVPELFPDQLSFYGNELGYVVNNGPLNLINEGRSSSSRGGDFESRQMIDEGINPAYVEDDEERLGSSFRMRVNGVNRDEINT